MVVDSTATGDVPVSVARTLGEPLHAGRPLPASVTSVLLLSSARTRLLKLSTYSKRTVAASYDRLDGRPTAADVPAVPSAKNDCSVELSVPTAVYNVAGSS